MIKELTIVQNKISELLEKGVEIPQELEEKSLRLLLIDQPNNFKIYYSLTGLLIRMGCSPFPNDLIFKISNVTNFSFDDEFIVELLSRVNQFAIEIDSIGVFATFWYEINKHSKSVVFWLEYARHLAERGHVDMSEEIILELTQRLGIDNPKMSNSIDLLISLHPSSAKKILDSLPIPVNKFTEITPTLANLMNMTGTLFHADETLKLMMLKHPTAMSSRISAAAFFSAGDLNACATCINDALKNDFQNTLHWLVRSFSGPASIAIMGKDDYINYFNNILLVANDLLIPSSPSIESKVMTSNMYKKSLDALLPSALFITQPKSGSVSVGAILQSGFGLPTLVYSYINVGVIDAWIKIFAQGGASYVTHLLPTKSNINKIFSFWPRNILINIRDPRQWAISYCHHLRRYRNDMISTSDQSNFDVLTELEQIEYAVQATINGRYGIPWIRGWFEARDQLNVRWFTYERFLSARDDYVEDLIDSYGGSTSYFDRENALTQQPLTDYHFRSGKADEWRYILSSDQIRRINEAIPNNYWTFFGWNP